MKSLMRGLVLSAGLLAAVGAFARSDVRDGNAMIKPEKNDRYSIDGSVMGKAELYGYIGDLRDREKLSGLVLKRGGNDEQRRVIGSIARAMQLKAFEQEGGELKSIDLPAEAPAPAPPPIENKPEAPVAEGASQAAAEGSAETPAAAPEAPPAH